MSFWLYPLLAALLIGLLGESRMPSGFALPGWLLSGLLVWSLLEYLLHRFFFHWIPENRAIRRFLAKLHLRHHGDPREPSHILVRPHYSLPISLLLLASFAASFGWSAGVWIMVGTWSGFLYYELVHYRIHVSKQSNGLLGVQRRWHFYHHFIDDRFCFGVTSPLWDLLLGTYRRLSDSKSSS